MVLQYRRVWPIVLLLLHLDTTRGWSALHHQTPPCSRLFNSRYTTTNNMEERVAAPTRQSVRDLQRVRKAAATNSRSSRQSTAPRGATTNKDSSSSSSSSSSPSPSIHQLRTNSIDLPYSSAIAALRAYHSVHNDLALPRRYKVPTQAPFPPEWYHLDLATTVYNMKWWQRYIVNRPERVSELNALGFIWERLQPEWNVVLESLVYFHTLHGHCQIPSRFVVPRNSDLWPKATWGIPLGNVVHRMRSRNDFLNDPNTSHCRRQQLESLGFCWDVSEHRFQTFCRAVEIFANLQQQQQQSQTSSGTTTTTTIPTTTTMTTGNPPPHSKPLRIPSTFVVPNGHEHWPPDLWDYPLGAKVSAVRQKQLYIKDHPQRQQQLQDLGLHWTLGNANLGWLQVSHAAAIYSRRHGRVLDVPVKFVVPHPPPSWAGEWPWPEHLWGLPLGDRLKNIRLSGAYLRGRQGPARKAQLNALGFVWNPRARQFQLFCAALIRYQELHGTLSSIPTTYVIPDNHQDWPRELWKYKLGSKAASVRRSNLYIKNHPDRVKTLQEMGFL